MDDHAGRNEEVLSSIIMGLAMNAMTEGNKDEEKKAKRHDAFLMANFQPELLGKPDALKRKDTIRLDQLAAQIFPESVDWDGRRLSMEQVAVICPIEAEHQQSFIMPSIRKLVDEDFLGFARSEWPFYFLDDLLYWMDMEFLHTNGVMDRLLFTRKGRKLCVIVAFKNGSREFRYHPQGKTGIRLRRDAYVFFRFGVLLMQGDTRITLKDLVDYYLDKFAHHRFYKGLVPYPAGASPKQVQDIHDGQLVQTPEAASFDQLDAKLQNTRVYDRMLKLERARKREEIRKDAKEGRVSSNRAHELLKKIKRANQLAIVEKLPGDEQAKFRKNLYERHATLAEGHVMADEFVKLGQGDEPDIELEPIVEERAGVPEMADSVAHMSMEHDEDLDWLMDVADVVKGHFGEKGESSKGKQALEGTGASHDAEHYLGDILEEDEEEDKVGEASKGMPAPEGTGTSRDANVNEEDEMDVDDEQLCIRGAPPSSGA